MEILQKIKNYIGYNLFPIPKPKPSTAHDIILDDYVDLNRIYFKCAYYYYYLMTVKLVEINDAVFSTDKFSTLGFLKNISDDFNEQYCQLRLACKKLCERADFIDYRISNVILNDQLFGDTKEMAERWQRC